MGGITEQCFIKQYDNECKIENLLQSYFLVFKKDVFLQDFFKQFFIDYRAYKSKADAVFYGEDRLSKILLKNNITLKKLAAKLYDPFKEWKSLLKAGSPFIKKNKFIYNEYSKQYETLYKYKDTIKKYSMYDITLIENYLALNNIDEKKFNSFAYLLNTFYENIKHIRKKLFQIHISKKKKVITLFGIKIYSFENNKEIFSQIKIG